MSVVWTYPNDPPMAEGGLRLRAYNAEYGYSLGLLPDPLSAEVTWVRNNLGALKLVYPGQGNNAELVTDDMLNFATDIQVEVWNPAGEVWVEPKSSRFIRLQRDRNLTDQTGTVTLTMPSYGWLLRKTHVWGGPAVLVTTGEHTGQRPFESMNAGEIMATLLAENTARGGVNITPDFTASLTSLSSSWTKTGDFYFDQGTTMFDVLQTLASAGFCDWWTDGTDLHMVNADEGSLDATESTRLGIGLDIIDAPTTETLADYANVAYSVMDDGLVYTTTHPTAPSPWGDWVTVIDAGEVSVASAAILRDRALAEAARLREELTRQITLRSQPMVEYQPGDWISAPILTPTPEVARVEQVTMTLGAEGISAAVVLNDRNIPLELKLAGRRSAGHWWS